MTHPDIELDLLRAFVAVAESGSYTAAAEVIHRSQSAVSQKVLRLEELLGWRVFDRTSRSLRLTAQGSRLLISARRLLDQYDTFFREVREPSTAGTLRLGLSENLVPTQFPELLSQFSGLYPDVQLELTTGPSAELVADQEAGRLDIVVIKQKRAGSFPRGRVIWREPLVWVSSADYVIDEAAPARLIMMKPPCAYREVMIETMDAARRDWVTACTVSNRLGVQAAVLAGLGITVQGESFVQAGMKVIRPSKLWPPLPTTEVTVIGNDPGMRHLIDPLLSTLVDGFASSARAAA
jgi:DNA-binding transcriptional LysR family regulator